MLSTVIKRSFILITASLLLFTAGCTRDVDDASSPFSSSSPELSDDEELPPEESNPLDEDYGSGSDREWYSYSGVGLDKISWTQDGEHIAVVYHQLVQLVDLNNQLDGEIPFPEGYVEEYAVGERGVLFYGKQIPRNKAYPSRCLWQTQDGKLFVAGIALMEYDGTLVKEVPAVEVRSQEGQADTYWFGETRVLPVETYEESWKWVDSKTLLLTTVQQAPDAPNLTCNFYYRYYPNTDKLSLIISGNSYVTVRSSHHGIFYDSYHTPKGMGSIWIADDKGTRTILDDQKFTTYAVSDDIIAMLKWPEDEEPSLWYADMDDLDNPRKITGIDSYVKNMGRGGLLDDMFRFYIPLAEDLFYDVSIGEVVEVPSNRKKDMVNSQGTHWLQHDDEQETYRVMPME